MSKHAKLSGRKKDARAMPMVVFTGLAAGALLGYFGGETVLYYQPHPIHWLGFPIGGAIGWLTGKAIVSLQKSAKEKRR